MRNGFDYIGLLTDEDHVELGADSTVGETMSEFITKVNQPQSMPSNAPSAYQGPGGQPMWGPSVKYDSKLKAFVPAAAAAKSCGANGMTWAHFLALAIFIACLVAVNYGVQKYRERKAA
jgi:hypothetical protein